MCSVFGTECSETWNLKRLKQYLFRCDSVMTISRKLSVFLKALCTILGCIVFLFSLIFPFYYARLVVTPPSGENYFWSYKSEASSIFGQYNYWLSDYWFSLQSAWGLEIPWILMSMFTIQLLTLALGLVSIRIDRRCLFFAPVLLSSIVAVLMIYSGEIFGHPIVHPLHAVSIGYQVGYYVVFPSLAMFLSAFILNEVIKKQQTKDSRSV